MLTMTWFINNISSVSDLEKYVSSGVVTREDYDELKNYCTEYKLKKYLMWTCEEHKFGNEALWQGLYDKCAKVLEIMDSIEKKYKINGAVTCGTKR